MDLLQNVNILDLIIILGILIFGLIECFFGYRIFKLTVKIVGFLLGATLVGTYVYDIFQEIWQSLLAGLVGGIIGAFLMVAFYFVGIFLIGAFLGVVLGTVLSAGMQSNPELVFILILAVIMGFIALKFQKFMIIASTGFGGAWIVIKEITNLTIGEIRFISLEQLFRYQAGNLSVMILFWLALGIVGVFVQYKSVPTQQNDTQSHRPPIPSVSDEEKNSTLPSTSDV